MNEKMEMLKRLNIPVPGNLKFQEFDVLNPGSILTKDQDLLIINEGLLMYFDREKQSQILKNIHSVLQENGGTWVTADIYLKHETGSVGSDKDKNGNASLNQIMSWKIILFPLTRQHNSFMIMDLLL
ncbi:hypothetical protein OWR28_12865 [Chryseobacterium sp. 1B4]